VARWRATDPDHRTEARVLFLRALHDAVPEGEARSISRILFDDLRELVGADGRGRLHSYLRRWNLAAPWIEDALGETAAWWSKVESNLINGRATDPTGWRETATFQNRPLGLPITSRVEPPRELVLLTIDRAAMLDSLGLLPARDAVPTPPARPRHGHPWPDRPGTFDVIVRYQVSTLSVRALAAELRCSPSVVSRLLARWQPLLELPPRKPARNGRPVHEKGNTVSG
jgi:hypothetical protein